MYNKPTTLRQRWIGIFILILLLAASCWGYQGIITPLYVGNLIPALDQFGEPMVGSNLPELAAGRSRVELRVVKTGQIFPPTPAGLPDPSNPLVTPDSVYGMGLNASLADSGIFATVFTYRLPPGTKIFARVFNAPTLEESTFYADSLVAIVPKNGTTLVLTFGEAQPLDSRDIDADGLVNSWETVLGTDDRFAWDYDGDGISDLDEMLAGTDPTEAPPPPPVFRSIARTASPVARMVDGSATQSIRVGFQSVSGKKYEVQYMSSSLTGPQTFVSVDGIQMADSDQCEMIVDIPAELTFIVLRLRIVP